MVNKAFSIFVIFVFWILFPLFPGEQDLPENPLKVAALGDSITWGFGLENRMENSWPSLLQKLSDGAFITENFGRNGATVSCFGDRSYIETSQYRKALEYRPDVIIISLGTNDTKKVNRQYLESFTDDYVALIRSIREQVEPQLLFITYPPPLFDNFWTMEPELIEDSIIPMIDNIAYETDSMIIDLYHPLQGKAEYFSDGVHPDERGANLIAELVFTSLKESLEHYIKN